MPPVVIDLKSAEDERDVVHRAVQALAEGGLVALPTETVYGVAASALDEEAVLRLATLKGRNPAKPLALAIKSADEARDYAPDLSPLARRLARRCWPGPVTLVVDDSHPESLVRQLPAKVRPFVSPKQFVGLRVPGHAIVLDILRMLAGPLVLSSANQPKMPESVTAEEVLQSVGGELSLVVDDGRCRFGQPSSVVRIVDGRFEILREGVVPERTLRRLSSLMILFVCTGNTCRSPMAEMICRRLLAERLKCGMDHLEEHGVIVTSAGTVAMLGGRAANEAIQCMDEIGVELRDHETQPLTEPLVRHADMIYAMTRCHREAIVSHWPSAAERTQLLSPDNTDLPDPIGGSLECYRQCASQIETALQARLNELEI
ncbi:MAG: threonylcarbamoyl-AMP synthase [Planctomycetaceae bacterium]|nr:threonylcarbamoyl-AMP synthase [Planctomycetaceae bacterium]